MLTNVVPIADQTASVLAPRQAVALVASFVVTLIGVAMVTNFRGIAQKWRQSNIAFAERRGGAARRRVAYDSDRSFRFTGLLFMTPLSVFGLALLQIGTPGARLIGIVLAVAGFALGAAGLLVATYLVIRAAVGH